jgi:beta-glucanase (GH16 family)
MPRLYLIKDLICEMFRNAGAEIINPIQSARIVTSNSFSFTYGTVEVRAKMPRGDWIWPGK